jgi:hypothetical protein
VERSRYVSNSFQISPLPPEMGRSVERTRHIILRSSQIWSLEMTLRRVRSVVILHANPCTRQPSCSSYFVLGTSYLVLRTFHLVLRSFPSPRLRSGTELSLIKISFDFAQLSSSTPIPALGSLHPLPSSVFRLPSPDLCHTSDFRHPTSSIRHPTSSPAPSHPTTSFRPLKFLPPGGRGPLGRIGSGNHLH